MHIPNAVAAAVAISVFVLMIAAAIAWHVPPVVLHVLLGLKLLKWVTAAALLGLLAVARLIRSMHDR